MNSTTTRRITVLVALFVILTVFSIVVIARSRDLQTKAAGNGQTELTRISIESLGQALLSDGDQLIIDIRTRSEFLASHVPDAISIPSYEISLQASDLEAFQNWKVILICQTTDCPELERATRDLRLIGFSDLSILEGGYDAYLASELPVSSQAKLVQDDLVQILNSIEVGSISTSDLKSLGSQNVTIVDVRTTFEFVSGFIPGAINIPLHRISETLERDILSSSDRIVIYDRKGNRSKIGAKALEDAGFSNVLNLEGGLEGWLAANENLELPATDGSNIDTLIPLGQE